MGIFLELMGIAISLLVGLAALKRAGIDIGWLNPFTFFHRLAWKQKLNVPALYCLEHPVDVASALALAMVQHTGMVTTEQKQGLIELYAKHLSASAQEAEHLWIASSYLLRRRPIEPGEVPDIFSRNADKFSPYHVQTMLALMSDAALLNDSQNAQQQALIEAVRSFFVRRNPNPKSWTST
jgi:hypothetical protein